MAPPYPTASRVCGSSRLNTTTSRGKGLTIGQPFAGQSGAVVDSDDTYKAKLIQMLEEFGLQVTGLSSPDEANALLEDGQSFTVIFIDISMGFANPITDILTMSLMDEKCKIIGMATEGVRSIDGEVFFGAGGRLICMKPLSYEKLYYILHDLSP